MEDIIISCLCEKVKHKKDDLEIENSVSDQIPLCKMWLIYRGCEKKALKIRTNS